MAISCQKSPACKSDKTKSGDLLRQTQAESTLRPELQAWLEQMTENASTAILQLGLKCFPVWNDGLRGGGRRIMSKEGGMIMSSQGCESVLGILSLSRSVVNPAWMLGMLGGPGLGGRSRTYNHNCA